jgi:putative hemolysin
LGVARAPDLVCDLLEKRRIDLATLERAPLTIPDDRSVLEIAERIRAARVPLAVVRDRSGGIQGVITPTDLLGAILGARPATG